MSISKKFYSLVVAGLLAFSNVSHAVGNTTVYNFGNLLTGDAGAPNNFGSISTPAFAKLSATDTGLGVWSFILTINNNFFSSFGNSAFVSTLSFDFDPNPAARNGKTVISGLRTSRTGGDVKIVSTTNGTGGSGSGSTFDFGTGFGKNSRDRLTDSEWVSWTVSGLEEDSNLNNTLLHVQGLTGGGSAKYTPLVSPVPEPETYAMLLAGLGLVGFAARRRKQNY